RVNGYVDRPCRQYRQVDNIPFRAVFGPDGEAVAFSDSSRVKSESEVPHSLGDLIERKRLPFSVALEAKELIWASAAPPRLKQFMDGSGRGRCAGRRVGPGLQHLPARDLANLQLHDATSGAEDLSPPSSVSMTASAVETRL